MKSMIKSSEALSSTKEILNGESNDIVSVMGRLPIKLNASSNKDICRTKEIYFIEFLNNGVKKDANSGSVTKSNRLIYPLLTHPSYPLPYYW